jgi:hypothetical protein
MSIFGVDCDDAFAYETPKVVIVRDRWLGILKLVLSLGVVAYVIVTLVQADPPGYVKTAAPFGVTTKLSLQRPPGRVFDSRNMSYCADYDYSRVPEQGPSQYARRLPCWVWDEGDVAVPIDEFNSMFITTRVKITEEKRLCALNQTYDCKDPWGQAGPSKEYFVLGVDEFTLLVNHAFHGPIWVRFRWILLLLCVRRQAML